MKIIVRFVVSILILVLASASVANIHTRAIQLHADGGWQTWGISVGFAVSFALFSYLLIASQKTFFFLAASFGAVLTGVMQTGMYLALGADWFTALGLGCGGPVLEALLAMAEHYIDEPTKKQTSSIVWTRLGNALVSRIERPNAVQLDTQPVQLDVSTEQPTEHQTERPSKLDAQRQMLDIFTSNPNASLRTVGKQIKRSPTTISNWLTELGEQGIVHVNGQGVEVKEKL